ncbi:MAG: hypothetical protein IKM51_04950, partial [Oscillospiraceae bacterium]|nr:hypothetical protein [Oscillospiraceae bacterium]
MKKFLAIALIFCMLFTLSACGGKDDGGKKEDSSAPELGVYNGVSIKMFGSITDMSETYSGENTIELKKNGKCVLTLDGDPIKGE